MIREAQVWLKIVMHFLIHRLHYTDITRDRVCLVYALMTPTELNIGVVLKSAMRKARVHKGYIYSFGGIITRLCRAEGVPEEILDYMSPLFPAPMYGLEMLRHQNGCRASTDEQLGQVARRYPLNAHVKSLLGIGPEFHEPVNDDIQIDEDRLRTGSVVSSDSEMEEVDPTQAGDEAWRCHG
uniref:Putative plant transposon protein domain-containing protein n=1 Tax=Solanum tuberosum TaxID=4113 RepID=M1DGA3_SOLTU